MNETAEPLTRGKVVGFLAGAVLFFGLILASPRGFVVVVDHANLLFHEAGHVLIGLFSATLEPYGGTIGQLFWPAALAVHFWRRGQTLSVAGTALWFFQNLLNIAHYVADARAMQLPLVGGGQHDWNWILGRWQLLPWDTRIATVLRVSGWIGMLGVVAWVVWCGWRDWKKEATD